MNNFNIDKITDGLGKPIDPLIKKSVTRFNVAGFETVGSCEGHLAWASPAPYVDIRYSSNIDYAKKYSRLKTLVDKFNKAHKITPPLELRLGKIVDSGTNGGAIRIASLIHEPGSRVLNSRGYYENVLPDKSKSVFGIPRSIYLKEAQKIMDKFTEELEG